MGDEIELIVRRFTELARRAEGGCYFTFTDFLGLAEQSAFEGAKAKMARVPVRAFGGAEGCERVMLRFGDPEEIGYDEPFPIRCLKVEPVAQKFADALTHRDVLGSLMNLGIEREVLGDIVIRDNVAYVFCAERMAPFFTTELSRVKHTDVRVSVTDDLPEGKLFATERVTVQAVGERIDAVIAKVYHISRDDSLDLFRKKLVFADGRQIENNSYVPHPDERISVRGYGRFIYRGAVSETRKGKLNLVVEKYV